MVVVVVTVVGGGGGSSGSAGGRGGGGGRLLCLAVLEQRVLRKTTQGKPPFQQSAQFSPLLRLPPLLVSSLPVTTFVWMDLFMLGTLLVLSGVVVYGDFW